jgi:hypothetical protein
VRAARQRYDSGREVWQIIKKAALIDYDSLIRLVDLTCRTII